MAERFEACDGLTLSRPGDLPVSVVAHDGALDAFVARDRVEGTFLTRGGLGLLVTMHRALGEIAADQDDSRIYLICEDDAVLCPSFPARFAALCQAANAHDPSWGLLRVGYLRSDRTSKPEPCGYCRSCAACQAKYVSSAEFSEGVEDTFVDNAGCPALGHLGATHVPGCYGLAVKPRGAHALLQS